jgi:lipoprotein-anchoring transpeptidase ErfK/SrfK
LLVPIFVSRALVVCGLVAASGMAWPESPPPAVTVRPYALEPARQRPSPDTGAARRSRHRRSRARPVTTDSGEVASAFDTLASALTAPAPAPSRYRSRADSVASARTRVAADQDSKLRVVISLNDRRLWVLIGSDTLLAGPVAVSMDAGFEYAGKAWRFETPRGVRTVLAKRENPVWIPPDWHYAEVAREHSLGLASMSAKKTKLSDGNWLEVRDSTVGLVYAESGEFAVLPTDEEIVFDETLFIPPVGTLNRRIEGELGNYALDTGGGILLHGTPHKASIGAATTHGCIRLRDQDIQWLFEVMPLGTRVYIY